MLAADRADAKPAPSMVASMDIDLAVLQVFPLSLELPEGASIREVLASRPAAPVVLNILGGLSPSPLPRLLRRVLRSKECDQG